MGCPLSFVEVLGKDGRSESEIRLVGKVESLFGRVDLKQGEDGSEELLLVNFGLRAHALQHEGVGKVSVGHLRVVNLEVEITPRDGCAALFHGTVDLGLEFVNLLFQSKRPAVNFRIHGVSDFDSVVDLLEKAVPEFVINLACDNKSLGVDAGLTRVTHPTFIGGLDSLLHVGILQDDEGVISSEFKAAFLHVLAAGGCDVLTRFGAASKLDGPHSSVGDNFLALTVVNEEVLELTLAKSCFFEGIFEGLCTKRCRWGVLQHD